MSDSKQYTRGQLIKAAQQCKTIEEVIHFFGTRPYGHLRSYLFKRFAHFGIDVSHFHRREYRQGGPRPDTRQLSEAIAGAVSISETLRLLGRPDNTSQRAQLHQWVADDGLNTSHFLGQAHQRGKPPSTPAKRPEELLVKREGKRRTKTIQLRRALREIGVAEKCRECNTGPEWNGKPMTLEIDHINGDWSDDRPENLRLLCPNCHAITSTWCRGGSRYRRS